MFKLIHLLIKVVPSNQIAYFVSRDKAEQFSERNSTKRVRKISRQITAVTQHPGGICKTV